jgi:hypothetical protein
MSGLFYKFAVLMAVGTLVLCLVNGISIVTSVQRGVVVFIGTLLIIAVSVHTLRWVVASEKLELKQESSSKELTHE